VFGFSSPHGESAFSALRALKVAQRRLRPEVRSKLLTATSARFRLAETPEAWRFVFLDPATSGKCRIVTVAAKTSSEHPDAVEAFGSARMEAEVENISPITQSRLLVDSDRVLELARQASKLKGAEEAEYQLQQRKGVAEPTWLLRFFTAARDPLAVFSIGARTGSIEMN
jgi:hypothetical protein